MATKKSNHRYKDGICSAMRFSCCIVFFLGIFSAVHAQEDENTYYKIIQPKHAYNIEFALPVSVANKPFKGIMQGFVRASANYQFSFKQGLNMGLGFNYTYFQINRFKITPQISGGMHLGNAYLKLGYEKFYTERVGIDAGIKAGYSQVYFHSDSLLKPRILTAPIVEPYFAFCLSANQKTSYKWMLSYAFLGFGFFPERLGDDENQDYPLTENKRITRFFSFGFSYSHYFKQW